QPWQRLEREEVLRWLGENAKQFDIGILSQAASSNTLLMQHAGLGADAAPGGSVLAVELQTAGRGRMGRVWHSGLGSTLTFSLLWRFDCGLNALSGLSLAVGVAIARALNGLGAQEVRLKWPNDILIGQGGPGSQRKLGGVLIEAQGDMLGPSAVVIGIGLNCFLPENLAGQIDQPAGALDEVCHMHDRNRLLAAVLRELADALWQFAQEGFAVFSGEWEKYHIHQDQPVQLRMADGTVMTGVARGVSESGELLLETAQGVRQFNSGEVGVGR
ncbi:MAG TPA: biotin--[acetyl-CoA-carboxylase] ligase, partial [Gallionella sp.]|nr:biotin--[acetyl-CoA-carboxylase] ligase [Gallionella sp.]